MRNRELNQRLARMQAQIDALDTTRPSRAVNIDFLDPDTQAREIKAGNVYNGKVYS